MFDVHIAGAKPIRVGFDHLWKVFDKRGNSRTIETQNLRSDLKLYVQKSAPAQYPNADLLIPPYTMGALLADGYFGGTSIQLTTRSSHVIDRVLAEGINVSSRNIEFLQHYLVGEGAGIRNSYKAALGEMGLLSKKSRDKFIPEEYLTASVEQRKALLEGLFDCDGSVRHGKGIARYATSSAILADNVEELVQSLGGWISSRSIDSYGIICLNIASGSLQPFSLPEKIEKMNEYIQRDRKRMILSVTPSGEDEAICFSVESDDHLYLAPGYVVTHNTMASSLLLKDLMHLGYNVFSTTFTNMIDMFTAGWNSIEDKRYFEKKMKSSQVLLLDDVGKEFRTKNNLSESTFDSVLKYRVQHSKPTFLTTNMTRREMNEGYGSAILSLLYEAALDHEFQGLDFRKTVSNRTLEEIENGETRPIR